METEKKWLWKATMAEMFFDASNRFQTFMVSYQLTVATAAPLLEDQVTSALSHLYRYGCIPRSVDFQGLWGWWMEAHWGHSVKIILLQSAYRIHVSRRYYVIMI